MQSPKIQSLSGIFSHISMFMNKKRLKRKNQVTCTYVIKFFLLSERHIITFFMMFIIISNYFSIIKNVFFIKPAATRSTQQKKQEEPDNKNDDDDEKIQKLLGQLDSSIEIDRTRTIPQGSQNLFLLTDRPSERPSK